MNGLEAPLEKPEAFSIAWGIGGAGHWLAECVDLLERQCPGADLFLSRAALEVLGMHGLHERAAKSARRFLLEKSDASVEACCFTANRYQLLVLAPATANSVAKFARGIADSLLTNLFAQAGKSRIPTLVLPTDQVSRVVTKTPAGKEIILHPRAVDLENVSRLVAMEGVEVFANVGALSRRIEELGALHPK